MDQHSFSDDLHKLGRILIVLIILTFFLGIGLGMFVGCKTTQNIKKKHRSKVYNIEKDRLFSIVVDQVSDQGYMVDNMNKEMGIISTKPKTGAIRRTFQARVKELSGNRSELTLTLNYEYQDGYSYSSFPMTSANRDFYSRWFQRIDSAIK